MKQSINNTVILKVTNDDTESTKSYLATFQEEKILERFLNICIPGSTFDETIKDVLEENGVVIEFQEEPDEIIPF